MQPHDLVGTKEGWKDGREGGREGGRSTIGEMVLGTRVEDGSEEAYTQGNSHTECRIS
jgi:hypothetical protein